MATATKTRKPITPAQTDKVLKALDLRYAVMKMADRFARTTRECAEAARALDFDESAYRRLARREHWQREASSRLLDAGMSAYKAEVYR